MCTRHTLMPVGAAATARCLRARESLLAESAAARRTCGASIRATIERPMRHTPCVPRLPSGAAPASVPKKEASMSRGESRRGFLGRSVSFGVAACAMSGALPSWAQGKREIKFSHGTGLCNMPLFYAAEKKLFAKYAIESNVVLSGWAGDQAIQLATGKVEMGVIPYTNAIAAYTRSPSFAVVSGSGTQGLIMVGQPSIKTFADMRGKRGGTFQADTPDILVYDYLKKQGMTYKDIKMQYLGNSVELTNAFIAGQLDVMSAIEPYATRGLMATKGNILGDGVDIYGAGYPDCVLIARKELIDKDPKLVKDVIKVFFEAEAEIESNFEEAAKTTINKYYKTDMADRKSVV